tara:strand:+ start:180 stop:584 length:405 start_codon:yes stop_codon:yes gene_type:complete
MKYFIFNATDESLVVSTSVVNSNFQTDDYLVATLDDNEYERGYVYTYSGDNIGQNPEDPYDHYGRAVKGDAVEVDQDLVDAMDAEEQATRYQRDRKDEYPSIGDQLDALFKAGLFPAEMATQIQAVKDAHPKPE